MVLLGVFTIVLGLSLIYDTLFFFLALPSLPGTLVTYPAIGLVLLGIGIGVLIDEIRDVEIRTRLEDLDKNPERKRQCYAWMLGYYSKYVLFVDRNSWNVNYDDRSSQQARVLGIGDEELYSVIRNFPTLTIDESSKLVGLGLEFQHSASALGASSLLDEMPERIKQNVEETRRLLRIVEGRLGQEPIAYKCFLIPILTFQISQYPNLDLVDMPSSVEGMRDAASLSRTLQEFEANLANPFIPKKLLASLRKLIEQVARPPSLRPGEARSDVEIERVHDSRVIDSLLESVEKRLADAGWKPSRPPT